MEETKTDNKKTEAKAPQAKNAAGSSASRGARGASGPSNNGRNNHRGQRNERPRKGRKVVRREDRKEFEQKILKIRRVTRVVAGGRRFSFSVAMAIGDRRGNVGVGIGKAGDTALAIDKAIRDAKKNMVNIKLNKEKSIAFDVAAKFCASQVQIMPAPGKGIVAGSSVRNVLELAGVRDVSAKIHSRSKNRFNNARAAIMALSDLTA